MKRLGYMLLLGAALIAQTGCDEWEDFSVNLGYLGSPGYGWHGSNSCCRNDYIVQEYWVEETYYESSWYDSWFDIWFY